MFGGDDGEVGSGFVAEFDPPQDNWSVKAPAFLARNAFAVSAGNRVFVGGGFDPTNNGIAQDAFFEYVASTDEWISLSPLPSAVGYATATLVGSRILIVGGQTVDSIMGGTVLDIVQVYDITTGLWSTTRPLPAIRTRAACGVIGGSLVVAGGISVMGMPTVDALLLDDGFMQHHYHRKD